VVAWKEEFPEVLKSGTNLDHPLIGDACCRLAYLEFDVRVF
jgi:hypothetical protein